MAEGIYLSAFIVFISKMDLSHLSRGSPVYLQLSDLESSKKLFSTFFKKNRLFCALTFLGGYLYTTTKKKGILQ